MKLPRRLQSSMLVTFLTIDWFLTLPFPFENGWHWFGGFLIIRQTVTTETGAYIGYYLDVPYVSWWDVLAQLVLSFLLAIGTYFLIKRYKQRQKDT
jgi:hypothetical protein